MWDDEQSKRRRGQSQTMTPNDVLSQVDQQFSQAGVNLNVTGSGRRQRTGCAGVGCGIFGLLTIISFIGVFVFAFGIAFFPDFAKATSPLYCPKNTTLKTVEGAHTRDGTEIFFQCFDAENQMVEEVSGKFVLTIVGLVLLPFVFIGLGVIFGVRGASRAISVTVPANAGVNYRTINGVDVNVIDLRDKLKQGNLTDVDREQVAQVFRQFNQFGSDLSTTASGNVTERLRELQKAYDAGLITADEYELKRREILNQL